MNKAEREQRNLWRDQVKEAVTRARADQAAHSQEERGNTAKREFIQQRVRELLNFNSALLGGPEFATKILWINRLLLGKTPARNPDAPRIAPRYEAWPVEGEIPEWLRKRFADEHWLWNALAQPVQHAIWDIKAAIADVYRRAEAEGLDTKDSRVRKDLAGRVKSEVDFRPLKQIEVARAAVLKQAHRIRSGNAEDTEAEMRRLGWCRANWNFALAVAQRPAWLQRLIETRISAASKARRTRSQTGKADKGFKGYPQPDLEERREEGGLDIYFNGQNRSWSPGEMKNSYVAISEPWNPPDHRGSRKGKYRLLREMRKVTLREPESNGQNRFSLNVLFHSVPAGGLMKGYKLRAKNDTKGKLHWFFIPTFELASGTGPDQRTFVGIDMGWRISSDEGFKHVHCWDELRGYHCYELKITDTRWSHRYNDRQAKLSANEQFPIQMTPAGLRDFASRKGSLQRDFKARMGEVLTSANLRPANWDRIGRRGMSKMMMQEKSPEFAALQCLRAEYDGWARRDAELARIYRTAWGMVSANLDRLRREIARKILSGITDIGVEALDVKQMAEAQNEGTENWERHIENVQDRSRQLTGPAKFKLALASAARKAGKRIHWLDPAYTSKCCSGCRYRNDPGSKETFTCSKCGRNWNRDENAARNLEQLARECAGDGTHPLRCSHDGKRLPFHGLPKSLRPRNGTKPE